MRFEKGYKWPGRAIAIRMSESLANTANAGLPETVVTRLVAAGLLGPTGDHVAERLAGGVSSDIWKVTARSREFCVKRALPQLRVAADWRAPVERNAYEVAWCRVAETVAPGVAPEILFEDPEAGLFAMTFYPPSRYRLWKPELLAGRVDVAAAREVGVRMARIHTETAGRADVAAMFDNEGFFKALRLEPYLEATARIHEDLAAALLGLSDRTGRARIAMVHGDISPKNILLGPDGPVFLDAECGCIGDPAFDVAFCLNHLFLKRVARPDARPALMQAAAAMSRAYFENATFEQTTALEVRVATLLPGLMLARIDGKSPVEYITSDADKDSVRAFARDHISAATPSVIKLIEDWLGE